MHEEKLWGFNRNGRLMYVEGNIKTPLRVNLKIITTKVDKTGKTAA